MPNELKQPASPEKSSDEIGGTENINGEETLMDSISSLSTPQELGIKRQLEPYEKTILRNAVFLVPMILIANVVAFISAERVAEVAVALFGFSGMKNGQDFFKVTFSLRIIISALGIGALEYLYKLYELTEDQQRLWSHKLDEVALEKATHLISDSVLKTVSSSFEEKISLKGKIHTVEDFANYKFSRALELIKKDENILIACQIEGFNCIIQNLWRLSKTRLYNAIIYLVLLFDISLLFGGGEDFHNLFKTDTNLNWCYIKLALATIELADAVIRCVPLLSGIPGSLVSDNVLWASPPLCIIHTTDAILEFFGISIDNVLPISPLILIVRSDNCRRITALFFKTIFATFRVLIFLMWFIFALTATGYPFLKDLGSKRVENLRATLTTIFDVVVNADGITALIHPAVQKRPWTIIYFVILCMGGSFYVMGALISAFQYEYEKWRNHWLQDEIFITRCNYVAAFILLESDSTGKVERSRFSKLIKNLYPKVEQGVLRTNFEAHTTGDHMQIDKHGFVRVMHLQFIASIPKLSEAEYLESMTTFVHNHWFLQHFMIVIIIIQISTAALHPDRKYAITLYMIHVGHFLVRVFAFGANFWSPTVLGNNMAIEEFRNRLDSILMIGTSVSAVVGVVYLKNISQDFTLWLQTVLGVSVLRCFTISPSLSSLAYMLSLATVPFLAMLVLLFMCMILMATWTTILAHYLQLNEDKDVKYEIQIGGSKISFKDMQNTMLVMIQLFMGDAFPDLIDGLEEGTGNSYTIVFWILLNYTILTALFGPLVFGVILTVFGNIYATYRETGFVELRDPKQLLLIEELGLE